MAEAEFQGALEAALKAQVPGVTGITALNRLSGGASQETFAFDALKSGESVPLILRRAPSGQETSSAGAPSGLPVEAKAIMAARRSGVAAPEVIYTLQPADKVGPGYVMERVEGETIARKILRDSAFDNVRPLLARQCGEALAQIHKTDTSGLPELQVITGPMQLAQYYERYQSYDQPKPVFELAFAWLRKQLKEPRQVTLVHGDFRHGNIIIHPQKGLASVLDWEGVHKGDPLEDLSWVCINAWRFGVTEKIVGGFGDVPDMLAAYQAAGGDDYTPDDVKVWEVFGSLKWGIMCMGMYEIFRTGYDRTVERAAIGRRSSENEIDLVNLLLGSRA